MSEAFLAPGGTALLSLKAASERSAEGGDIEKFSRAEKVISESKLELVERIDLSGLEEQHAVFHNRI